MKNFSSRVSNRLEKGAVEEKLKEESSTCRIMVIIMTIDDDG